MEKPGVKFTQQQLLAELHYVAKQYTGYLSELASQAAAEIKRLRDLLT